MLGRYVTIVKSVDAIQFQYNEECIEALKEILGENFVSIHKARNPYSFAILTLKTKNGNISTVNENDYLVWEYGKFFSLEKRKFEERYEQV